MINLMRTALKFQYLITVSGRLWLGTLLIVTLNMPALSLAQTPDIESHPGAGHLLLLKFGGHEQPGFVLECGPDALPVLDNDGNPRLDRDGNEILRSSVTFPSHNFTQHSFPLPQEFTRMFHDIWQAVAEDYSAFDVNVRATINPLPSTNGYNTNQVAILAIGDLQNAVNGARGYANNDACLEQPNAYRDNRIPNFAFVDLSQHAGDHTILNVRNIAQIASHEAGHLYGLFHRRTGPNPVLGIAPIMTEDASRLTNIQRFTWQNSPNVAGDDQDDVAVISEVLGQRNDDHGNTSATATLLNQAIGSAWIQTPRVYEYGVIESPQDEDKFIFRVTGVGKVTINAFPAIRADIENYASGSALPDANTRITIELRDRYDTRTIIHANTYSIQLNAVVNALSIPQGTNQPTLTVGETYHLVVRGGGQYENTGMYTVIIDGQVADLSGPRVIQVEAGCTIGDSLEAIRVHFDQPVINPSIPIQGSPAFAKLTGKNGIDVPLRQVLSVPANHPTPRIFDLVFPATGKPNDLQIVIGIVPIRGFGLDLMRSEFWINQIDDGNNGIANEDEFTRPYTSSWSFAPPPCALKYAKVDDLARKKQSNKLDRFRPPSYVPGFLP